MVYKPPFKLALRMFGYGKGNFIVVDSKGREYPHGGTLKTERRARNYLKGIKLLRKEVMKVHFKSG